MPLRALDLTLCDQPPRPPDWIVEGLLERGGVCILSGDTGASKSLVALSICVAVIRGVPWLGRAVKAGGVIVCDAEMVERVAVERLRGFGVRGSDGNRFAYLSRQAIDLQDPQAVAALRDLSRARQARVLVLDALMGHAPGVDVNDNSSAVALYAEVLRPLAAELQLAVLLVHHESKAKAGLRDSSQATMGARQWVAQADVQVTLERAGRRNSSRAELSDGSTLTTYRVRLRLPKRRDAPDGGEFEPLAVTSRHEPDRALDWIKVERDQTPTAEPAARDHDQARAEQLGRFVKAKGRATTAEMAAELEMQPSWGTFKAARDRALAMNLFERVERGVYR
ncbi:MAG TPA: AAA family ATPase [Solirubrobacteraceae bacterium]|nr:AAA family ATPase [Solirubrobacteraceae bacterium]